MLYFTLINLQSLQCVRFHPNGNYVLTASADKTMRLWDLPRGRCVRLFTAPSNTVSYISCLAISPDGKYAASGYGDGQIAVWDIATAKLLTMHDPASRTHFISNST
jgi:transcription initiation factor TFIID subunit 5